MAARPVIKDYMTTIPVRVDESSTLRTVLRLMERYDIRHVLVTRAEKLAGVLSQREVAAVIAAGKVNVETDAIAPLMGDAPYQVAPETPLRSVAKVMQKEKFGSAVVVSGDKILGIFTAIDALRALVDHLQD